MANSLTNNPIRIDTKFSNSFKGQTNASTSLGVFNTLLITEVYWFQPSAVGQQFIITNPNNGNVLLQGACEVASQSQFFNFAGKPKLWQDFAVPQLDSGVLYIGLR